MDSQEKNPQLNLPEYLASLMMPKIVASQSSKLRLAKGMAGLLEHTSRNDLMT
jgi:hypothetical protein